jgi:hypothetical protein
MMALEEVQPETAFPEAKQQRAPKRLVVAVKHSKVTAFEKGAPTDLGGLRSGLTTKQGQLHEEVARINREIKKLKDERRVLMETPSRVGVSFTRRKHITEEIDKLEQEREAMVNNVPPEQLHDQLFIDKQGREWKFQQATTKEIETNTDIKYYHNALASALVSALQLRKAERGFDFVESFKNDPDFSSIAQKQGEGNPPDGWKTTDLPQLRGYYFEKHVAETLDWYAKKLKTDGPNFFDKLGSFLRTSIFFNPLIHTPNIAVHWAVEKGPSGFLHAMRLYRTSTKAINAVVHQNQDFLDALDAGAPLQSQREDTAQLQKLFFDQLAPALEKEEPWALKLAKALGMSPVTLTKAVYKFSKTITWGSNDIAFLQATYEKMEAGMPLKEALAQTAKHIPDYRLPVRILNSTTLGKLMSSPRLTMFGAYHYGALKSYAEMAKSALGMTEPPTGRSQAGEVGHGLGLLAWLGLITFVLYPLADELLKKTTGDKNARLRRAGASTFLFNMQQLVKGEKSPGEVVESVATPAVHTKLAAEAVTNRDFYTGKQFVDWHADWRTLGQQSGRRLIDAVSPAGQAARIMEGGPEAKKRFLYGLVGVTFPRSGAEKVAQNIAAGKPGTQAWTAEDREKYYAEQAAIDGLRKGDEQPLEDARAKGLLSQQDIRNVIRRSRLTWLQDKIDGFSYGQVMEVYNAPGATPEQKEEIEPILRRKRRDLLHLHRAAEVEQVEAAQ